MTLDLMDARTHDRFRALCKLVTGRSGPGLTLAELRDCTALARELERPDPDGEQVELFCERLGVEREELEP